MKRIIITSIVVIAFLGNGLAQKFAFVDSEYILSNIPSYKAAQDQLDRLSEEWQKEIETQYSDIEKMYKDYQAERVLLTEEMRRKKEDEIINKEREVKELQKKYFGTEGMLYKKREELIKPIQDEVYNAVQDIANENGYAVIFDSASGPTMLYSNARYDISDEVLQKMGYKN